MKPVPELNIVALLIAAISILAGVIVWLALEIRKMHNRQIKQMEDTTKVMVEQTKDFVRSTGEFRASIDASTKSQDNMIKIFGELHDSILTSGLIKRTR